MGNSASMDTFGKLFHQIKIAYDAKSTSHPPLLCKQGSYGGCHVLKLQKTGWTNDDMQTVPNKSGIFFSIWMDDDACQKNRVKYNIHALKLRQLRGYKMTSRNFAQEFRHRFAGVQRHWPNVSVDFGPLTLMEGWIDTAARTFEHDAMKLMNRFEEISPIIDELLAKRRLAT